MMADDLGVEAKEAAVREVAKLLPLPELLQSISSIKADYIARQQVSHRSTASFSLLFVYCEIMLNLECVVKFAFVMLREIIVNS